MIKPMVLTSITQKEAVHYAIEFVQTLLFSSVRSIGPFAILRVDSRCFKVNSFERESLISVWNSSNYYRKMISLNNAK